MRSCAGSSDDSCGFSVGSAPGKSGGVADFLGGEPGGGPGKNSYPPLRTAFKTSTSPCNLAIACCRDLSILRVAALEGPGKADRSDYESTLINPPVSRIFVARGDPARAKLILCCTLPKVRKLHTAYEQKRLQAKISDKNICYFCTIFFQFRSLFTPLHSYAGQ